MSVKGEILSFEEAWDDRDLKIKQPNKLKEPGAPMIKNLKFAITRINIPFYAKKIFSYI